MGSDDKEIIYKNFNKIIKNTSNYVKPFSKFNSIPSNDKINLYSAICTDCHTEFRTNFEPVDSKPFYCDYCYNHHRHDYPNLKKSL
jgi:CxxC-x17-CxxC domain-containing protein